MFSFWFVGTRENHSLSHKQLSGANNRPAWRSGNVSASLVLFMQFFLPTLSTIEVNASDVTPFKLTNTSVVQNCSLKQRKVDEFLFHN